MHKVLSFLVPFGVALVVVALLPLAAQTEPVWPGLPAGWEPPRMPWGSPDLTGIWDSKSSTPLQRAEEHADLEFLTDEEVAALDGQRMEREQADDAQGRDVRAERGTQADVEGAYNNIFSTGLGTRWSRHQRTSLIIDPPSGRVPEMTEEGQQRRQSQIQRFAARAAAQSSAGVDLPYFVDTEDRYDNPEDTGNLERCMGVTIPCTGGLCGFSRIVQGRHWLDLFSPRTPRGLKS